MMMSFNSTVSLLQVHILTVEVNPFFVPLQGQSHFEKKPTVTTSVTPTNLNPLHYAVFVNLSSFLVRYIGS